MRWEKKFFFCFHFQFDFVYENISLLFIHLFNHSFEYTDTPMLTITNMPMGDIYLFRMAYFFFLVINQIDNDADEMAKKKQTEV